MDRSKWITYLIVASVGCVGLGIFVWKGGFDTGPKFEIVQTNEVEAVVATIWVDIAGQVVRPGVYELVSGDRVGKVIEKAGGFNSGADLEWVNKNLNQAAKVSDGMKIYVPARQERNVQTLPQGDYPHGGGANPKSQELEKININTASQAELEALPGIGPATAIKVIQGRPYSETSDLQTRKIVSAKVYEQIKETVTVW